MARKPVKKTKKAAKKPALQKKAVKKVLKAEVVHDHDEILDDLGEPSSGTEVVSSSDPLQKYLSEIRRYPLLSPKEEKRLAVLVHEKGDTQAAQKLVTANLRFVVKIAAEYTKFGARMIDLIQEGNVGLMQAVKEFNPYKGVKLITYAVWWIRGYIQEYLMRNYSQVKIGTTQAQRKLFYHLNREKARLDSMGEKPNVKLLSSSLGVSEDEVREMEQRMSGHDLSLDAPVGGEESGARTFVENQVDQNSFSADDAIARNEEHQIFQREISTVMKELNEKEIYLLQKRILGDPPLTLQEVGDHFKITRERARQLEERVVEKLKKHFQKIFPDYKINVPEE